MKRFPGLMKRFPRVDLLVPVLLAGLAWGCAAGPANGDPTPVRPGLPGESSRQVEDVRLASQPLPHTRADVEFMQGMIHHHAQAVVMTELARSRAGSRDIELLALRIALSQDDEIALMGRWLRERGEDIPGSSDDHMHHMHHMTGEEEEFMPGMLTQEQMARLEAASGAEFDRLFLEYMIHHHEGALVMVHELFSTEGAAQEVEIYEFAAHVEADQAIEIRRMQAMLQTMR